MNGHLVAVEVSVVAGTDTRDGAWMALPDQLELGKALDA